MKLQLIVVVLSCTFLVFSCANVIESDENVFINISDYNSSTEDKIEAIDDKPNNVATTEIQEILSKIRAAAEQPLEDEGAEVQTEPIIISANNTSGNNREAKQLIGFLPACVLRDSLGYQQEQQYQNFRSLQYEVEDDDDDEDAYDELEEERAVRRRKRFRKRNLKSHLKKSRHHRNTNKSKLQNRRRYNANRKTQNRSQSNQRRPPTRNKPKTKKRKNYKRRGGYQ